MIAFYKPYKGEIIPTYRWEQRAHKVNQPKAHVLPIAQLIHNQHKFYLLANTDVEAALL